MRKINIKQIDNFLKAAQFELEGSDNNSRAKGIKLFQQVNLKSNCVKWKKKQSLFHSSCIKRSLIKLW